MKKKNKSPKSKYLVETDADKLESEKTRKHLEQIERITRERSKDN